MSKATARPVKFFRHCGVLFACGLLLAACAGGRALMPTPNLYLTTDEKLFGNLHPDLSGPIVKLLYITDRVPERDSEGRLHYGHGRSNSLAAGTVEVNLGRERSWGDLLRASRLRKRTINFELELVSLDEFTRLPGTPFDYKFVDGTVIEDPATMRRLNQSVAKVRAVVARGLALTPRKEVFLFVHGYRNSFADGVFAMAELWHFLGREGLPVVDSWPAGYPGLFGYTYDRESSEFTVHHLKQTLRFLAGLDEIEHINIIAHSRGTDVAVSAIRELVLEYRGAGRNVRELLKVKNLILAAPDMDFQVASQRVGAERISIAVDEVTVYTSPEDKAIGLAESLFSSPRGRLGTLDLSKVSVKEAQSMEEHSDRITIINFIGKSDRFGHSYFRTNPAVSSDLMLLLRYDYKPGSPERPLEHLGNVFWRIPDNYPGPGAPQ